MVSILGTAKMILGIHSVFGYLDPWGLLQTGNFIINAEQLEKRDRRDVILWTAANQPAPHSSFLGISPALV